MLTALPYAKFTEGFAIGLGLFAALGPKDSLILRQGLGGKIVWPVVWIFVCADIVLIAVGMAGVGNYLSDSQAALSLIMAGGALYLVWFGGHRLRAAVRDTSAPSEPSGTHALQSGLMRTAMVLAFANPYAWIDTVVILGVLGGGQLDADKLPFGTGAMSASCVWFTGLASGSTRFQAWFRTRLAWRVLDVATALMMFYLAIMLMGDAWNR